MHWLSMVVNYCYYRSTKDNLLCSQNLFVFYLFIVNTVIKTDKPIQLSIIVDNTCTLKSMQRVVDPCVAECGAP